MVPIPGITAPSILAVTAYPTVAPASAKLLVLIPIIWSAASSIVQTLRVFAQVPGFLEEYVKDASL